MSRDIDIIFLQIENILDDILPQLPKFLDFEKTLRI